MSGLFARVSQRVVAPHTTPRAVLQPRDSLVGALREESDLAPVQPVTLHPDTASPTHARSERIESDIATNRRVEDVASRTPPLQALVTQLPRDPGQAPSPEPPEPTARVDEIDSIVDRPAAAAARATTTAANPTVTIFTEQVLSREPAPAVPAPQMLRSERRDDPPMRLERHAMERNPPAGHGESESAPTIHVTIDRMEVQAPAAPARPGPAPVSRTKRISLDEYLNGSRRR